MGIDYSLGSTTCAHCGSSIGVADLRYPRTGTSPIGCVTCLSTAQPGVYRHNERFPGKEIDRAGGGGPLFFGALIVIVMLGLALWTVAYAVST